MTFIEKLIIVAIISLIVAIGITLYNDNLKPTFELTKQDWVCTKGHTYTTMILVGKVMVPETRTMCDQWNRKGY